jgi:carbonic anhydrase/acetyltransferase-like protein (isoleucine patch superfamily)
MHIHPTAIIEDNVEIGADCEIAAYAVVKRFTRLGAHNRIYEHAVVGGEPQDVKFKFPGDRGRQFDSRVLYAASGEWRRGDYANRLAKLLYGGRAHRA